MLLLKVPPDLASTCSSELVTGSYGIGDNVSLFAPFQLRVRMMSSLTGHHQGLAHSLTCAVLFVTNEGLLSENEEHSWESDLSCAKMQMDKHPKVQLHPHEVIF